MPSTVVTPTASGISVARPRKNRIDSSTSSGNASISARPRSSPTVSPICIPATAPPPTVTPSARANTSTAVSATASSSALARIVAVTSPSSPARPVASVEATPGTLASSRSIEASRSGVGRVDEQHDARSGLDAGGLLDPLDGDLGVGAGGDEAAAAVELAGDRAAEHAGEHHEQQDRDQGAARVGRET